MWESPVWVVYRIVVVLVTAALMVLATARLAWFAQVDKKLKLKLAHVGLGIEALANFCTLVI